MYRHKKSNILAFMVFFFGCFLLSSGCAFLREPVSMVKGTSLQSLKERRDDGVCKTVPYALHDSFERVIAILSEMEAEILRVDSTSYAILALVSGGPLMEEETVESVFDANTADVGVFFSEKEAQQTEITVSCFSASVRKRVSEAIFSQLN